MRIVSPSEIQEKMNRYGSENVPFLCGVNFELTEGFIIDYPLQQSELLFCIDGMGNKSATGDINYSKTLAIHPITKELYKQKFDIIRKGLLSGYSFLTNLTVRTEIETALSLTEIFNFSNSPFQICLPEQFVCFSPERFVKIAEGKISTNPMKGTIDASEPDAEAKILTDFKETAEHSTIVDLMRNDISTVANGVEVDRFRYIDRIKTNRNEILQVSSQVSGQLPPDYLSSLGDILFSLLPAGSISGAPKAATIDLIRQAENEPRGFYTGVFGYFDGKSFDSAVMIRFIEQSEGKLYFRSGGGITAYSNCDDEYNEVINKIYLPQ